MFAVTAHLFCYKLCISGLKYYVGRPHDLLNLGELVTRLTEDIDVMRGVMLEKEEKLAALFKKTSKIMSKYEKETGEMVEQLHKARDEQVFQT